MIRSICALIHLFIMHLTDAFIQSNLYCIQDTHLHFSLNNVQSLFYINKMTRSTLGCVLYIQPQRSCDVLEVVLYLLFLIVDLSNISFKIFLVVSECYS